MNRLLVVDDDRLVRFTLAEGLRQAGFEVLDASDGFQALAICEKNPIDLALLDVRMPNMDGLELARVLRSELKVPFLFLTAYDDEPMVREAVRSGALGYLIKPLDVAAILPSLRAAMARARETRDLVKALESNRIIATAVGITMRDRDLDQQEAFEHLRRQARDRCIRVEELARVLIDQDPTATLETPQEF
jgi:response regulator NasT